MKNVLLQMHMACQNNHISFKEFKHAWFLIFYYY